MFGQNTKLEYNGKLGTAKCIWLVLIILSVVFFSACDQIAVAPSSMSTVDGSVGGDDNYPVVVNNSTISKKPVAVISLSPTTTEMLYDMGYGDRVMGISEFCDYPEEALNKLRCGSALGIDKDTISLRPADLAVSTAPLLEKDLLWFQQNNIPVLILPHAESFEEIEQNYMWLSLAMEGETTGQEKGEQYYATLQKKLDDAIALGEAYTADNTAMRAILLREMSYVMATGDTFEHDILLQLGFTNDAQPYTNWLYPQEQVRVLEPDIIFCDDDIQAQTIIDSVVYKPVLAAINEKILQVDFTIIERQSPRMFELILQMAEYAYSSEAVS